MDTLLGVLRTGYRPFNIKQVFKQHLFKTLAIRTTSYWNQGGTKRWLFTDVMQFLMSLKPPSNMPDLRDRSGPGTVPFCDRRLQPIQFHTPQGRCIFGEVNR